ncbi:nostrin-like isoform X1 [Tachypleus tridentatus]|uniref:nostrin-like isoform X1 n=1 Tax=Tachypleus tridentatus TaxID=6853 RepID=UPI003FD23258
MAIFKDSFRGPKGFEELRKLVKHGGEFCREVASILQERSDLELIYAKGLAKLSRKLTKATEETIGTVSATWQEVAIVMENESELHKNLSVGLKEETVRPLKTIVECQYKTKKLVETMVEKSLKHLSEKRNEEAKKKKKHYIYVRENERIQNETLDFKVVRRKDIMRFENRKKKLAEICVKGEVDYYNSSVDAERTRLQLVTATNRAANHFQHLEEERLAHLKEVAKTYSSHITIVGPRMVQFSERLKDSLSCICIPEDINLIGKLKESKSTVPVTTVPQFYAEDFDNSMQLERRHESLNRVLNLLQQDLELERKGKQRLEELVKVSHEDVARFDTFPTLEMFLEATQRKIQCVLADLDAMAQPSTTQSLVFDKHKQDVRTILKVPEWLRVDQTSSSSSWSSDSSTPETDRGLADGVSDTHEHTEDSSSVFNSSEPLSDDVCQSNSETVQHCQALYTYLANLSDELTIHPGDVISVKWKNNDGWWEGELNGTIGLFPSSYVQEI